MIKMEEYVVIRSVESGTIYKRPDGILILTQSAGKDTISLRELQEQMEVFLEIQKGEVSPLMVIIDRLTKLDNEEKMFLTSKVNQFASKICVVAKSPIPTFIFNILIFLSRPKIPAKVFKTEKEGLEWLKHE